MRTVIRRFIARVRPEVRPQLPRAWLPSLERQEYVAGWRWGVLCGLVAGVLLSTIAVCAWGDQPPADPQVYRAPIGHPIDRPVNDR